MKKLIMALIGAAAMAAGSAQAASTSGQFDVSITLNSTCTLSTINAVSFSYTSFQAGIANSTAGDFTVTCTNTLPYSFGLQAGTGAPSGTGNASLTITDNAVSLQYVLNAPASGTGSGVAQSLSIPGTIAAGQSGTCSGASCNNTSATNKRQTLILTF